MKNTPILISVLAVLLIAAHVRAGEIHDAAAAGDLERVKALLDAARGAEKGQAEECGLWTGLRKEQGEGAGMARKLRIQHEGALYAVPCGEPRKSAGGTYLKF